MGGMSTEPFKLDLLACVNALDRCKAATEEGSSEGGEPAGAVIDELARQLHAAGAPDAPFEQQLATLLAGHLAMRAAGDEMPTLEQARAAYSANIGFHGEGAAAILDLCRPLFAKLKEQEAYWQRAAERAQIALGTMPAEIARLTQERDEAQGPRLAPVIGALRARVAELEANLALQQPFDLGGGAGGVTVRAVRRCMVCGGGGNLHGMPCGNCSGTGYCQ
jgi:hypothetical protein